MDKDKKVKQPKTVTMRFHLNIAQHDLEIKHKKIEHELNKRNFVKVQLQLLGREKSRPAFALEWLEKFLERYEEIATINKKPTPDNLNVILQPKRNQNTKGNK